MSWAELDAEPVPEGEDTAKKLLRSYVLAFGTNHGEDVLADLRARTLETALPARCTDAELRHLEGQRGLVRYIINQIERGMRSRD